MRKIGGFGMVLLLVVLLIVMLLVARSWRSVSPTAQQVIPQLSGESTPSSDESSEPAPAGGRLPDLNEMRKNTSQHADEIERLQDEIE